MVAGTTSAVNLTDGLDGLAAGCAAIVLLAYIGITFIARDVTDYDLAMLAGCLVGGCIGFLWFNAFPATIFMGDTGALGLGGAIAGLAVMTKTEVLLILLGGIFVIEALSVVIQVVSFQTTRKRVFLMAPIHHHFELRGVVGDEDHPALLDHRRDLRGDRLHDLPPEPAVKRLRRREGSGDRDGSVPRCHTQVVTVKPRPLLPPGPYLVVGLARSGVGGGAGAARARGAGRSAWTRASPPGMEALREAGVELHLQARRPRAAGAVRRRVVKSPGVPAGAPVIAAARARGVPVLGELELAWRLLPNEFIAVTGTNGKTTTVELIGHIHREAGLPVAVAGNVGTALSSLVGGLDAQATIVCETSSFQLEDTLAFAPEAAVLLNITPDHLDRHGTMRGLPAGEAAGSSPTRASEDLAVLPADLSLRRRGRAATPAACTSATDVGEDAGCGREHRAMSAPARRAQPPERDGRRGGVPGAWHRPRRGARGPAHLRRRPPPPGGGGPPRGRAVRQRLQGHQRRQHAGRAARLPRRRRPPDPRRPGQGPGLHPPARRRRAQLRAPST